MGADVTTTAERLLRSTAENALDGEIDIDWDAPVDPEKAWLTECRATLYGTRIWERLSREEQLTLGRAEAVAVLSYGIVAEQQLCMNLLRTLFAVDDWTSPQSLYSLSEVGEEARHSTMFGRLIEKAEMPAWPAASGVNALLRLMGFVPHGPLIYAITLIVEEILDRVQREACKDETVQPHVRQMMRIHILEEARHITYARTELIAAVERCGRISLAANRVAIALLVLVVMPTLIDPRAYLSVGISPTRGWLVAQFSRRFRENATFACGPMLTFFHEVGLIRGRVTTRVYRLSRSLPPEVRSQL
ncbi:AurF N-oxygenase family protein [Williamsia deligens]|uniref:Diiron oxygenase n=1 Tax=Williamsia deligens TaxID=321325 RepID=A0ABW3G4S3_9NOCA|nr:diiron oxygenase [Williamsia deligens]MCP2193650.1 P-aminobenzoate N-oxygenase AurF [Williamsia deligens]